jgi:hypothetical protein
MKNLFIIAKMRVHTIKIQEGFMSRRTAIKKIHYVRAVYNSGQHPKQFFDELVRNALIKLPEVADTKVALPAHGDMGVRTRHSDWQNTGQSLKLALAAGATGEAIGTFGANSRAKDDTDVTTDPPENRAFKLAEAFVLIEGDQVLVCTDGTMRGYKTVSRYFRSLFDKAGFSPSEQAFEFEPVSNQDKRRTLEKEGVKELKILGTMYAATRQMDPKNDGINQKLRDWKRSVQSLLQDEISEEDHETLAGNWGNFNVHTIISPKGGSRAEPIVLESLDAVADSMIDEVPDDFELVIKTRGGSEIKSGDVILSSTATTYRKKARNDLDHLEMWRHLDEYRTELIQLKAWEA